LRGEVERIELTKKGNYFVIRVIIFKNMGRKKLLQVTGK